MKNTFYKSLLAIALTLLTLPVLGQDFMNIYFKDGNFRKFYMKDILEIVSSKVDADNVQHSNYDYQHITTLSDKYIYRLEDVDSITFTKIDEEKAEQNFVTAMPEVFSAIEGCETIADVEDKINQIKNSDGVADAWCDGEDLFVSIAEDEVYTFHFSQFSHSPIFSKRTNEDVIGRFKALKRGLETVERQKGTPLKVVIANQLHRDEKLEEWVDEYQKLVQAFRESGIDAYYEPEPTIDFFYNNSEDPEHYNFYDYDIVMLDTHGSYEPISYRSISIYYGINIPERAEGVLGHAFVTSEDILIHNSSTNWNINYGKFKEWRDNSPYHDITDVHINYTFIDEIRDGKKVWVAHPALTEYFFRDIAKGEFKNPNSFFFNFCCHSLDGGENRSYSFANILFNNRKLGVYAGYTKATYFSCLAGLYLSYNMLRGASIEQSKNLLPAYCLEESLENIINSKDFSEKEINLYRKNGVYKAKLEVKPKTDNKISDYFLFPTITVNNDLVYKEYLSNRTATIEGFITQLNIDLDKNEYQGYNPADINVGFEFGESDDLGPALRLNESVIKESVDNDERGNCHFESTISDLILGKTYYYRAYTYDGLNYNYGETCSFTLYKDLQLANQTLTLKEGETGQVEITSGNGSYGIKNSNDTVATVTVNGEMIDIEAVSPGTATITVIDNKTGQTASFEVTVEDEEKTALFCPDHNHPHVIDLGLPSGTKWACCNIGSDKPEDYGSYYAWGETQTKETYNWSTYYYCNGSEDSMTKYCIDNSFGTVDNKKELDPGDDVATVTWGINWQMPSTEQQYELINSDYTTTEWISLDGIYGMKITSNSNGNSIFLPASGYYSDCVRSANSSGNYWSRSLGTSYSNRSRFLLFDSEKKATNYIERRLFGQSVRAVVRPETTDLIVSQNKVSMGEGDINIIQILSGSGNYTCGHDNNGVVNVSINNNTITIEALKIGDVVITVTDTQSGKLARIDVEVKGPIMSKVFFFGKEVDGVTYNIYKKIIDKNDIHTNPDGWKTYKSQIILEVIKNGNTISYVVDDDIYLDSNDNHHSGQTPCMLIDLRNQMIYIFCNSKDAKSTNYTMDGYFYSAQLDNLTFDRQNVFGNYNWGWYPYFTYNEGVLSIQHFSFAGYYAMTSTRSTSNWSTSKGKYIKPEDYMAISMEQDKVFVISDQSMLCNANVVGVELTKTEYHRDETYPNWMFFTVNAILENQEDVEEWGVYFEDRPGILKFAFQNVETEQSKLLYYNGNEGLMRLDFQSYVAQLDDKVGVYVTKLNKTTGKQETYYSRLYSFSLVYDTKPSLVISNPVIKSTVITGYDSGGVNKYRTDITHDYTLTGALWINYVDSEVSGGSWTFESYEADNPRWYPEKDGTGELTWVATYTGNTGLNHTNWRVIHLRNSGTIKSNYVNFTGDEYLTEAWVTDTPVYSNSRNANERSNTGIVKPKNYIYDLITDDEGKGTIIPLEQKREYNYKGGTIGAF